VPQFLHGGKGGSFQKGGNGKKLEAILGTGEGGEDIIGGVTENSKEKKGKEHKA